MRAGQRVVYVEKNLPQIGLITGQIYQVLDVEDCNCKTGPHIDVGIKMPDEQKFSYCMDCGAIINIDERWFFSHTGFRPIEDVEQSMEEQMTEYLKGLNY